MRPDQLRRWTRGRDQDIDVACHALGAAVFGEIVAVLSVGDEALATATGRHP